MTKPLRRAAGRVRDWLARRPTWVLVLIAAAGAAGAGSGGYFAYRTYDWVEHDNEFCMSCHLMQQPHELFAQSAHRGLGCKACHTPTFAARSQMALSQVIDNPDSLTAHAEVPNEKCASCHIEGDPERWESIARSAGHRVHLESDSLQGLQCVECHSSSLHQFAATDQTCGQSGCHTDVEVSLGAMSDLTIHCAACHGFSEPVADTAGMSGALATLAPNQDTCLTCHAMRLLVDMPPDEPHGAVCSSCHNPHVQATPAEAVESCGTAACHTDVPDLSAFHRGIDHPIEDCSACHVAHEFRIDGTNCLSCHQDIYDDAPTGPGRSASGETGRALHAGFASTGAVSRGRPPAVAAATHQASRPPSGDSIFRHAQHRDLDCTACHTSEDVHGEVTVEGIADCRSCHHTGTTAASCASCHTEGDLAGGGLSVTRTLPLSVGEPAPRSLPFDHDPHAGIDCASCHTAGPDQGIAAAACEGCHVEHHRPTVDCRSCHTPPPTTAHTVDAHVGCTAAGCHASIPFEGPPRDRNGCMVCHQDLTDHRPGEECVACHALPSVTGGGAP